MKMLLQIIVSSCLLLLTLSAEAHLTYPSEVRLDISANQAYLQVLIPVDELLLALPEKLSQKTIDDLLNNQQELLTYLYAHINAYVKTPAQPLQLNLLDLQLTESNQVKRLRVTARIATDDGTALENFILHYNVVSHKVINHKTLVTINSNFENGQLNTQAEPFGSFDYQHEELLISRNRGSWADGTWGFIKLGIQHIDEGLDHLAFLLCLLLLAPLQLHKSSWRYTSTPTALYKAVKLVSMFTLGHSISLVLVSFGVVHPKAAFIELLICATIMATAIHAIRPLPYLRESLTTLVFGLIHGAAFSETLGDFHFSTGDFALSLAGFNLGIEIAQIIAIALLLPWLLALRNITSYALIKNGLASFLLLAASYWLYERLTQQPVTGNSSALHDYITAMPFLCVLWAGCHLPLWWRRTRPLLLG